MLKDKELENRWIDALEGGNYPQGTETLRTSKGFCCLGVLCDVIDPSRWKEIELFDYAYLDINEGEAKRDIVPNKLAKKIGLSVEDRNRLIELNDKERKTFKEIAEFIRASSK